MAEAIKKIMERGYNERDTVAEFNGMVNYYMGGTLRTAEDKAYAIKCAVDDIMNEEEEEITDEYIDMLDMTYC